MIKKRKKRKRLNLLSPSAAVARTIYDGRVWVDCGATIPLGYLSASVKTLPLSIDIEFVR